MDSALEPVGNALYKVLNVPSLVGTYAAGVCAGVKKVWPKPPTNVQPGDFPLVWFELASEDTRSGLGRGPWLLELDVRVHTFVVSDMNDAQRITREVVRLLRAHETDTLPVAGWSPSTGSCSARRPAVRHEPAGPRRGRARGAPHRAARVPVGCARGRELLAQKVTG